jgi:asparagine synthase (glutamine-hydrolysing)
VDLAGIFHFDQRDAGLDSIAFDGRLDNRPDLLLRLGSGIRDDRSDAALALAAYTRWGAAGLLHLIGDWSLVLWDDAGKAVLLASDFAGVRPLYYCVEPRRLCWATRLQRLLEWTQSSELDDEYVAGLLANVGGANRTPYKGVLSVPPGHCVRVTGAGVSVHPFWTLPLGNTVRYHRESEYDEHLRELFRSAVECRLAKDEPAIAELSGGLDSSSVVCMAQRFRDSNESQSRLMTLTVRRDDSLDTHFSTTVERFCNLESIHVATSDFRFLGEDCAGLTAPAFWQQLHTHIAEVCRQRGAKTYLTGQLGDLIMGNRWDDSLQVCSLIRGGRIPSALKASLSWSKVLRIPIYWVLWRGLLGNLPPRFAPARLYEGKDGSYAPCNTDDSIAPEFRKRFSGAATNGSSRMWLDAAPERRKQCRELLHTLQFRKLQPPEPLQHLDYTHPYAHRPLVEFMLSIPTDVICGPGEPRRLMRRAFQDFWPPELRTRRSKDSFGGVLMDALRPLAKKMSTAMPNLEVVERGYVDAESLAHRLKQLELSLDCNEPQLRQIIALEFWLRSRPPLNQGVGYPSIQAGCLPRI